MTKYLLIILLASSHLSGKTQTSETAYPEIPNTTASLDKFVPKDWKVVDSAVAHLISPQVKNLVFVIQSIKPQSPQDTTCGSSELYFPKMIVIVGKDSKDSSYHLSGVGSKLFGSCNWGIQGQDPFEKISVKSKTLAVHFSTGGTLRTKLVYYFQYMRGQWLLSKVIDQTYQQGHPGASVVQWDWSNNTRTTYLTHDDGRHYYVKRVKMKSQSQYTLESFSGIPDR